MYSMLRSFLSHSPQKFYEADKGDNPAGSDTGNDPAKTEKTFTQTELDAILTDRLERRDRKAKADADKAAAEAKERALAEQGEYKTLAEQRASELATAKTELEAAKTHEQTAEKYRKALIAQLAIEKKAFPAHVVALLDKLDPLEQMEWITTNAEALKPASNDQRFGTPPRNGSNTQRKTDAPARSNTSDHDADRPRFNLG
jgi:hypothetical protein